MRAPSEHAESTFRCHYATKCGACLLSGFGDIRALISGMNASHRLRLWADMGRLGRFSRSPAWGGIGRRRPGCGLSARLRWSNVLAAHTDRPIRVDGALSLHIFARNPRLVAERVTIGNPPWTPPATTAEVGKITVVFATPRLGQELSIDRLQIDGCNAAFVSRRHGPRQLAT